MPRGDYAGRSMTYLDHAATTPMLPEAAATLTEALGRVGNASSLHSAGRRARRAIEESRESIAAAVGALPSEVVLATGGTEADNLAVKGLYWARRAADPRRTRVLVSAAEHHAVLDAGEWLAEHEGATLDVLAVDATGRVDAGDPARGARRPPRRGRRRQRHVGQQRGRHRQRRARAGRGRARVRRPVPHRRRAGRRRRARRLRRQRRRRPVADRAQARRPRRRRRPAAAPRRGVHPAAARRRPGARRPLRHPRRARRDEPGDGRAGRRRRHRAAHRDPHRPARRPRGAA